MVSVNFSNEFCSLLVGISIYGGACALIKVSLNCFVFFLESSRDRYSIYTVLQSCQLSGGYFGLVGGCYHIRFAVFKTLSIWSVDQYFTE